jgi:hypothetical protein
MRNIFDPLKNKTRVLILSTQTSVPKLFLEVLDFHQKDYLFYSENNPNSECDFVILATSDFHKSILFEPNIVLITSEISHDEVHSVLNKIIAGGVLIHHSNLNNSVEKSANFFRKLEFTDINFQRSNPSFTLETKIGSIPISFSDENLIKNIKGLQLLAQQFGIMEEDFYESVMNFE